MSAEKKLCLFAASVLLVLTFLSIAPSIMAVQGIEYSPAIIQDTSQSLAETIEPLQTIINLVGTKGLNNWYSSDVTVTFSVISSSEVTTAYSYDGKNWILYSDPFVLSTEGITTIYYNSTDSFGYTETTHEETIKIDKTPPVLTLETEIIYDKGVQVTITAVDALSGYLDIGYSLDGKNWKRYAPFNLTDEGIQPVYYRTSDMAGNEISKLDYVEVVIIPAPTPTEVTYTGDTSGVYSDSINLEASLVNASSGSPIANGLINFTIGSQTILAITNAEGIASGILVLDQPSGVYEVSASFDGDDMYLAASDSSPFLLSKEDAFVFYSGLTIIEQSDSKLILMATVLEDADDYWGDVTKINVTFTIYSSSDPTSVLQVLDSITVSPTGFTGIGIATAEIPNLSRGEYIIVVSLDPEQNQYYWGPDSDPAIITVYRPARESVSGAGWIEDADGNKGHFVFLVKYKCRRGLEGFIFYTLRADDVIYFVKSDEITGFTIYENHAFFEASIIIFMYDLHTKEKVQLDDTYRLRVDVWDYKKRHGKDIFQIQIFDEYGLLVYEAGFDPLGYVHRGNIVIHTYCHHRHHKHHKHHGHYWYHRCHCHRMRHW